MRSRKVHRPTRTEITACWVQRCSSLRGFVYASLRGGAGSAADREEQCHHQERPGGRGHLEPIHHAVRAKGGDGWMF